MAWTAIGVDRFRAYQEYKDMFQNLSSVQEICTAQLQEIRDLKRALAEKQAMLERLMAIALLTNPQSVEGLRSEIPPPSAVPSAVPDTLPEEEDDGLPFPRSSLRPGKAKGSKYPSLPPGSVRGRTGTEP